MTVTAARPAPDFSPALVVSGLGAVLAGPANVVMQLSWPAIGHGVAESRVDSGAITKHPLKRTRTTFSFLAVALLGDDEDRRVYREAVNTSHRQVRSTPTSPVTYNAFDPRLQMWVAACLYWGTVDLVEKLHGPLDDATADALYQHCAYFGTTLQVPRDTWPPDRAAFADYWARGLEQVSVDPTIRRYLRDLVDNTFLPAPLPQLTGRINRFVTAGFLPPLFRSELGYEWTPAQQRRFERLLRAVGRLEDRMPPAVRAFPFNVLLWDVRRRVRKGIPLV